CRSRHRILLCALVARACPVELGSGGPPRTNGGWFSPARRTRYSCAGDAASARPRARPRWHGPCRTLDRACANAHEKRIVMNWDTVSGKRRELEGEVRSQWGKSTDQDPHTIGGKKDMPIGRLQQHH